MAHVAIAMLIPPLPASGSFGRCRSFFCLAQCAQGSQPIGLDGVRLTWTLRAYDFRRILKQPYVTTSYQLREIVTHWT